MTILMYTHLYGLRIDDQIREPVQIDIKSTREAENGVEFIVARWIGGEIERVPGGRVSQYDFIEYVMPVQMPDSECAYFGGFNIWVDDDEGQASPPDGAFIDVDAARLHSCGVRDDGTVTCWGANEEGQLDAPDGAFRALVWVDLI